MFRDFYLVSNQFKLWMLTTDIAYLRDTAVKGFETIVQRNKNFLQVRLIPMLYVESKVNESRFLILYFQEMFDKSYISDIFSNEIYTNKVQVVRH